MCVRLGAGRARTTVRIKRAGPFRHSSMSSTTRKALRDFYKLPSEAQNGKDESGEDRKAKTDTNNDNQSLPIEQDEDDETEDTKIEELDNEEVSVKDFVHKLAQTESLERFVAIADQIKREEQMLASSQRELVNDNYKKLIFAAETLGYLSSQGDLAGVSSLDEPVERLTKWTQSLE